MKFIFDIKNRTIRCRNLQIIISSYIWFVFCLVRLFRMQMPKMIILDYMIWNFVQRGPPLINLVNIFGILIVLTFHNYCKFQLFLIISYNGYSHFRSIFVLFCSLKGYSFSVLIVGPGIIKPWLGNLPSTSRATQNATQSSWASQTIKLLFRLHLVGCSFG